MFHGRRVDRGFILDNDARSSKRKLVCEEPGQTLKKSRIIKGLIRLSSGTCVRAHARYFPEFFIGSELNSSRRWRKIERDVFAETPLCARRLFLLPRDVTARRGTLSKFDCDRVRSDGATTTTTVSMPDSARRDCDALRARARKSSSGIMIKTRRGGNRRGRSIEHIRRRNERERERESTVTGANS